MRLPTTLEHPTLHAALTSVGVDQHHREPVNLEVINTTLSISPLPGGPGQWDIAIPFDTLAVVFSFRSPHVTELAGGVAGVVGLATRSQFDAATASLGGHGVIATTAYNATYAKAASALYLSHKVFNTSPGICIALTEIYLATTGPSTRVLRTIWTNFCAGYEVLNVQGEILVLG